MRKARCKACGNMYQIRAKNKIKITDKVCNVCKGTNTTPNGNRITENGHKGIYIQTNIGTVHALIDPDASKEVIDAIKHMAEKAYQKH